MRRLIVISGIVLMVFAFVILSIFIIGPSIVSPLDDAPLLRNMLQSTVCNSNEVLTANYSTYNTPTSTTRSTHLACVDSKQNARDVNQQIVQIGAIGYLVPFLAGLFMSLVGGNKKRTSFPSSIGRKDFADRSAAPEKSSHGDAMFSPSEHAHSQTQDQPDHLSLAQRLRELKEAYSAGLVTEEEYTAKRKELLDER